MADPLLRLDATSVAVQPGGQAQVSVTVTSASDIVEGYRLTVLGAQPTRWAEVVPPTVNVYPGEEATAVVVFSPPAGTAAPSGVFPFAVKATSTESADASSVVEGTVELGRVAGVRAKIVPVTSTGRWRGRHVIRLDNGGNAPARLRLVATDPDANLGFYVSPDVVDLAVGGSTSIRLSARVKRPFLRGSPVRHPFQVVGEPLGETGPPPASPYGDPGRPVVDAALLQKPILTRGVVTLVGLLLVAAVAGGAYAWTRPQGAPGSLAKLGTPPTPADFRVVGSDATSVRLRWKPVDQIDAYGLQHVDPGDRETIIGEDPVNGSQNGIVVQELPSDADACFRLLAVRAGLRGPPTEVVCGRTTAAPASPSPSPSPTPTSPASSPGETASTPAGPSSPASSPPGSPSPSPTATPFGPGQWVLVASFFSRSVPGGQEAADRVTQQLQAAGLPAAQTVDSRQYPALKLGDTAVTDVWLSVAGPYATRELALLDCAKVDTVPETVCVPTQPQPL